MNHVQAPHLRWQSKCAGLLERPRSRTQHLDAEIHWKRGEKAELHYPPCSHPLFKDAVPVLTQTRNSSTFCTKEHGEKSLINIIFFYWTINQRNSSMMLLQLESFRFTVTVTQFSLISRSYYPVSIPTTDFYFNTQV